jgi:hypothetical protein
VELTPTELNLTLQSGVVFHDGTPFNAAAGPGGCEEVSRHRAFERGNRNRVETGPTEQIYQHPSHAYTQMLLSSVPNHDPRGREERRAARATLRASSTSNSNV